MKFYRVASAIIVPVLLCGTVVAQPYRQDSAPSDKQLKHDENASKEQAKADKQQRKALKAKEKSEKAAKKSKDEAQKAGTSPS